MSKFRESFMYLVENEDGGSNILLAGWIQTMSFSLRNVIPTLYKN